MKEASLTMTSMNSTENRNALCRLKLGAGGKHSHQRKRAFNILFSARRGKYHCDPLVVDNSLWTVNFYCDYSLFTKRVTEIFKIGELTPHS